MEKINLEKKCETLQQTIVHQVLENVELEGRIFELEKELIRIKKTRLVKYEVPDSDKFKEWLDDELIKELEKRGMIEEDPDEEEHTG